MDRTAPPAAGSRWIPREVLDVKLRAFTPPGETLELVARRKNATEETATVAIQVRMEGKRIGTCRVNMVLEENE
jgi:hypothetical protein